jgi:hypothetical protein
VLAEIITYNKTLNGFINSLPHTKVLFFSHRKEKLDSKNKSSIALS